VGWKACRVFTETAGLTEMSPFHRSRLFCVRTWECSISLLRRRLPKPCAEQMIYHPLQLASFDGSLHIHLLSLRLCFNEKVFRQRRLFQAIAKRRIERNKFPVARGEDVIGRLGDHPARNGDTLPDIARHSVWGSMQSVTANSWGGCMGTEAGERVLITAEFYPAGTPPKRMWSTGHHEALSV